MRNINSTARFAPSPRSASLWAEFHAAAETLQESHQFSCDLSRAWREGHETVDLPWAPSKATIDRLRAEAIRRMEAAADRLNAVEAQLR